MSKIHTILSWYRFVMVSFITVYFSSVACAEMRDWKDVRGNLMRAELVSRDGDVVTFRSEDGKVVTGRIYHLSNEDQKYLNKIQDLEEKKQDIESDAEHEPLADALTSSSLWIDGDDDPLLRWNTVSRTELEEIREVKAGEPIFGHTPMQIQAYFKGVHVTRIEIIYLEAGSFYGVKQSSTLRGTAATRLSANEKRELQKKEEEEINQKRPVFNSRFQKLKDDLPVKLEARFGKGVKSTVGSTYVTRANVLDHTDGILNARLRIEDDHLISVTLTCSDGVSRNLQTASRDERRDVQANVKTLENGDVIIDNIPMHSQGSRGYCAVGTLAMITHYYGMTVNIDQLAAAAGYVEGDVSRVDLQSLYQAVAREAKLSMRPSSRITLHAAIQEINRGFPILVWRRFSLDRDLMHTEFLLQASADPDFNLPDPRTDRKDKTTWPTRDSEGHASLVTGYNKERDEILFTESWGEKRRHRRMKAKEMEDTCYRVYYFRP